MLQNIQNLESTNPKLFWSMLKKMKQHKCDNTEVPIEEWYSYFKGLHSRKDKECFDKVFEQQILNKLKGLKDHATYDELLDNDITTT